VRVTPGRHGERGDVMSEATRPDQGITTEATAQWEAVAPWGPDDDARWRGVLRRPTTLGHGWWLDLDEAGRRATGDTVLAVAMLGEAG